VTDAEALGTKEKILRACRRILEEQGTGARMSDIAKAAGVSRQAVYLHFPTRAELLIATIRYAGDQECIDDILTPSRAAKSGVERLDAYLDAWGVFLPLIYPVLRALLAMRDTDEAAAAAWDDRMVAMREGCQAAIGALERDGRLLAGLTQKRAVDTLWTLMSVRNYEHWVLDLGWSVADYTAELKRIARAVLVQPR
jgi:AcrR family transcriptional regulator